jgi:hypothetical protein
MNYFPCRIHPASNSLYERFCSYVHRGADHQCWNWIGASRNTSGYGQITKWENKKQTTLSAHRLAWELSFGPIPEGLMVRHMCHNRLCCNPTHLRIGTAKDNFDDKIKANRAGNSVMKKGEENISAKLTSTQVREIRKIQNQTIRQIARDYGVSKSLIGAIRNNQIWTDQ